MGKGLGEGVRIIYGVRGVCGVIRYSGCFSGELVAVKVMEAIKEMIEEIEEEYLILRDLSNCRNIPNFHGIYLKKEPDDEDQIWFVMEVRLFL